MHPLVVTEDHCIPEYRETHLLHQFCTNILRVNITNIVCLYCRYRTSTNSSKYKSYICQFWWIYFSLFLRFLRSFSYRNNFTNTYYLRNFVEIFFQLQKCLKKLVDLLHFFAKFAAHKNRPTEFIKLGNFRIHIITANSKNILLFPIYVTFCHTCM